MPGWNFSNGNSIVEADGDECIFLKEHKPIAYVSKIAERQIKTMLQKYSDAKLEWMAGMIGRKVDDNDFYIDKIVLFEQEVSSGSVELTPKGNKEAASVKDLLGMIHSHHCMGSSHSITDTENNKMYALCTTVNNDMNFEGKSAFSLPCGKKVIVECEFVLESSLFEEDEEISIMADKLIMERKLAKTEVRDIPTVHESDYDVDVCHICQQVVGKHYVECRLCSQKVHQRCSIKGLCINCFDSGYDEDVMYYDRGERRYWG